MKVALVFILLFATVLCRPVTLVSFLTLCNGDFWQQVAADSTSAPDTASVDSNDSEDDDDDDKEEDTDEDESNDNSESGESSTPAPTTASPVIITEEPVIDPTADPIVPTIVTDTARGDNLGGYPSDYKSIVYVEEKSYKNPAPYKSYEFVDTGKKTAYDMTDGNEVEKSLKVYKALQVHSDILEEDSSTPEVESQGLEATSHDQDLSPSQASIPEEEEDESASTASTSTSTSQESEDEESQSSEEATATPGAADSDSDESESDEEGAGPDTTTDVPVVITAK
uniref:Acidic repeat-containing protein-like n=1 Tax=Echeneis naucrates TaxID=173247 RepID=A0A665WXG0_ECHNA